MTAILYKKTVNAGLESAIYRYALFRVNIDNWADA